MPWMQLRIDASSDEARDLEQVLFDAGALAVTLEDNADQPILEPGLGETPLWQDTRVTGLFDAAVDSQAISDHLIATGVLKKQLAIWHNLEDKDWEREWLRHYQPIHCADKLWICPSGHNLESDGAIVVRLDPGLAFGTGTHPTTFMCLQWLAKQDLGGKTVVDYGCGSGILGIASLLLGAKQVNGIDIDPQALYATRENIRRNKLPEASMPVYFPNGCPDIQVDLVLANILAGPLVELAPTLLSLLSPGGSLCLSGILTEQADAVIAAYSNDAVINAQYQQDNWVCLTASKNKA